MKLNIETLYSSVVSLTQRLGTLPLQAGITTTNDPDSDEVMTIVTGVRPPRPSASLAAEVVVDDAVSQAGSDASDDAMWGGDDCKCT